MRRNYPDNVTQQDLAQKYDVSINSIHRLTTRLGLKCPVELRILRSGESRRFWTEKRIMAEIQRLAESEAINSAEVQKSHGSMHLAACNLFGSWKQAVEAAGFDYEHVSLYAHRRSWTMDAILQEIQRLHMQGEDLKASTVRDEHADLFNAARRDPNLGTWQDAIEAAGLSYDEVMGERWGSRYVGRDGYTYPSETEGKVGDRLLRLKSKDVIADYHNQVRVAEGRAWTCDFVIDSVDGHRLWLEVDGLGEARADGVYGEGHPKIEYYDDSGLEYAIVRTPKQAEEVIRTWRRKGDSSDTSALPEF